MFGSDAIGTDGLEILRDHLRSAERSLEKLRTERREAQAEYKARVDRWDERERLGEHRRSELQRQISVLNGEAVYGQERCERKTQAIPEMDANAWPADMQCAGISQDKVGQWIGNEPNTGLSYGDLSDDDDITDEDLRIIAMDFALRSAASGGKAGHPVARALEIYAFLTDQSDDG